MRIWSSLIAVAVCLVIAGNAWAQEEKKGKKKPARSPEEIFKKLDKDASGDLTLEEFLGKRKDAAKTRATDRFKKLDKDGNDKLTLEEFSAKPGRKGKKGGKKGGEEKKDGEKKKPRGKKKKAE